MVTIMHLLWRFGGVVTTVVFFPYIYLLTNNDKNKIITKYIFRM